MDSDCTDTLIAHSLRGEGFDASEDGTGRGTPLVAVPHVDVMPTMMAGANTEAGHNAQSGHSKDAYVVPVAFAHQGGGVQTRLGYDPDAGTAQTLSANQTPAIAGSAVRRLTPRECERLQGFPDDYTLIPWRKGMAPDGPRYKALGNSMAVPVMTWLGRRIAQVDALAALQAAA